MRTLLPSLLVAALLAASRADAQSLNLRVVDQGPVPSATYGAATGQAGAWNRIPHDFFGGPPGILVDLGGTPTAARARTFGCDWEGCDVNAYGPDVAALFMATVNGDCYATPNVTEITGLLPGHYEVTLYGSSCALQTHSVKAHVTSPYYLSYQDVGGTYNGSFAQMQLAHYSFDVNPGAKVTFQTHNYKSWSAVQFTYFYPTSAYCIAKTNSLGCVPAIGWTGQPSASAGSGFVVHCTNVLNSKSGLLLYKVGGSAASVPFQAGTLCIGPSGIRRTPSRSSGGTLPPALDCTGVWAIDMNAFAQGLIGGNPDAALLQPGATVRCQWWGRDPGFPPPNGSTLSDAVQYVVGN